MKIKYLVFSVFTILAAASMVTSQAFAASEYDTTKGTIITVKSNPAFSFQPSPLVDMAGSVGGAGFDTFAIGAAHTATYGKDNGMAYAMTSVITGLFSASVSGAVTAVPAVAIPAATETVIAGYKLDGTVAVAGTK